MNTKTLTLQDATAICEKQEDHFFERKSFGIAGNKVEKAVVAFANADGGEVLIGISDNPESESPIAAWNGASSVEDFNSILHCLYQLAPSIPFTPTFMTCATLPGLILQISIEKSGQVHQTSDKTIYVRRGASSLPIKDREKIAQLSYSKGVASFEDEKIPSVRAEEIVDSSELESFLGGFSPKTDPLNYVTNEYLLDLKTWEPKVAGILLFHPRPGAAVPRKCAVKVIRYETRDDDPEREHLGKIETVEGPLYQLIHDAIAKVSDFLSDVKIWTVDGLKAIEYPPETIWEVLVNAVVHRDYSISDDVQILIFDNRIEIKSPGTLPAHITDENILQERYTRNTKIVRTLSRYRNPPNKDIGEGLNTAFQKMKEWKLQSPRIAEEGNSVLITIPHTPLARPEELVLEFLEKHPEITNRQGRQITGIRSENEMKNVFYRLKDDDKLERVPERKGSASAWRIKT